MMQEAQTVHNQTNSSHHDISQTQNHILSVGHQLISKKGFTAVGLSELLKQAQIPKGSFYHHFASKEAFGEALIHRYFENYKTRLQQLDEQFDSPQQKLYHYFQQWHDTQQTNDGAQKCLVVKLSAEVSDLSEPMRLALYEGYEDVIAWLSKQIKAGQLEGSIPKIENISTQSIAKRWYFAWIGASLMVKVSQSNTPLSEVWQMTLNQLGC